MKTRSTSERIDRHVPKPEGVTLSAIEQMLARVTADAEKPNTFSVMVGGLLLYFRRPANGDEIKAFEKSGYAFLDAIQPAKRDKCPPELQEALAFSKGISEIDIINAFTIAYWSVEPEKITNVQAIKLASNPVLVDNVVTQINHEHTHGMMALTIGSVVIEKKDSKPTSTSNAE